MSSFSQRGWSVAASLCAAVWLLPLAVRAQGSAQIEVDLAESNARNHLQQADAFLADKQWDEAIETLRRVMENYPPQFDRARTDCRWSVNRIGLSAMRALGRLLQMAGLVLLPLSVVLQLAGQLNVGQLLMMLVFGACAFYLGRFVEGYAQR